MDCVPIEELIAATVGIVVCAYQIDTGTSSRWFDTGEVENLDCHEMQSTNHCVGFGQPCQVGETINPEVQKVATPRFGG
jgi:hypothetical protein